MLKRALSVATLACAILLGLAFLPQSAWAQNQDYFTYVSFWAVPRSEWAAFEKQQADLDTVMQKLVADGTIMCWGDDSVRVHTEDGYTHADWMMATSRANLLKALETVWGGATNAAYVSTTKHEDVFLHTLAHGGRTVSSATGYIRVASWQAKPGSEDAFEGFVMKSMKPMLDADVANGTLLMYNFDKEDIHTDPIGMYSLAVIVPDGASLDKFMADLSAAEKADASMEATMDSLTVTDAHRDSFGRVTAYQHK